MQKQNKKKIRTILLYTIAGVALLICVACIWYIWQYFHGANLQSSLASMKTQTQTPSQPPVEETPVPQETATPTPKSSATPQPVEETPTPSPTPTPMPTTESPIDFDKLHEQNADIYAWITVPDTKVDYPVLQSATLEEDDFYLDHGLDRRHYVAGCIFSEGRYNTKTFDDPMTILYGHNMKNGSMFANLNNYIKKDYFDARPDFYIYTPEYVFHYKVFGAMPYSSNHILYAYDFSDEKQFYDFFLDVAKNYSKNANWREEYLPQYGDKVVLLSTCYRENHNNRFIVMGKLVETMKVVEPTNAATP